MICLFRYLLPIAGSWGEFLLAAEGKGEDPPAGSVRERAGLSVLSDGRGLGPAAAGASLSPGPEPQHLVRVSLCALPGNSPAESALTMA